MKLKCIGGPNDGEYRESGNGRYGDHVAIQDLIPMPIYFDMNAISEITTVKYAYYKVEKLRWVDLNNKHWEWNFLLYEKLSLAEVFAKLFT